MPYKLIVAAVVLLTSASCSTTHSDLAVEATDSRAVLSSAELSTEPLPSNSPASATKATTIERNSRDADKVVKGDSYNKPKISIVIDDLGDNSIIARQLLSLPAKMTAAILPRTPHAKRIARFASAKGHEVIMHLPMEATSRPDLLGPGALLASMPKADLQQTLSQNADSVPHLVGFNNHMGSLLTQDNEKMGWVMEVAKQQGWYFLDSKTSQSSVAQDVALQSGLPTIGRDVFLDHHRDPLQLPQILNKQLNQAKRIAHRRGQVVIICHPYRETLDFLGDQFPKLNAEFELVTLSQLLTPRIEAPAAK